MPFENPKITVVGAGALGGLFGGLLAEGGLDVTYRESDLGHQIDPAHLREASAWLGEVLR